MSELKKPAALQLRHNNSEGFVYAYEKEEMDKFLSEADIVIATLRGVNEAKTRQVDELKKEIESMKVKFREFNDNVCKKIVDASRTMSAISQDAQMDFYEEFIKEAK